MAKKQDKLNLDDIDFDAAFNPEEDGSPRLPLDDDDDNKNDDQPPKGEDVDTDDESDDDDSEDENLDDDDSSDESDKVKDDKDNKDKKDDDDDDDDEDSDELPPLVDEVKGLLGFDIEDEFEDTPEGLVELTKSAATKMADTQLKELFDAMPDVEQYMQFRLQGGDSSQFFETFYGETDYSTTQVKEDDIAMQEHLVRRAMELKGIDQEDIKTSVEEFKNTGILQSQAEIARRGLVKYQSREKERLLQEQQKQAEEVQKQTDAYWTEVTETIQKSNELRGIPISEKDKKELMDYVSKPVRDGMSAFQIAMNEAPTDVYLAIAALLKRDFNLDGIVSRKASSLKANNLRERMSKSKEKLKSKGERSKGRVDNPSFDALDLSIGT